MIDLPSDVVTSGAGYKRVKKKALKIAINLQERQIPINRDKN